jgi:hypothetical protein
MIGLLTGVRGYYPAARSICAITASSARRSDHPPDVAAAKGPETALARRLLYRAPFEKSKQRERPMSKTIETETTDNVELDETELEAVVGGQKKLTFKRVIGEIWGGIVGDTIPSDNNGNGGGGGIRG